MSRGRVYSLDGKKAQANEDLIGGMCFVGQNPIRVLFDYGASCSFISFQCVETLQLSVSLLNPPYGGNNGHRWKCCRELCF
jgi:hypothetical protein